MKKKLIVIVSILAGTCILFSCGNSSELLKKSEDLTRTAQILNVDFTKAVYSKRLNTHNSKAPVKEYFAVIKPEPSFVNQLAENIFWDSFPYPKEINQFFIEAKNYDRYMDKRIKVPHVQNGYYYFCDRQNEYDIHNPKLALVNECQNYTIAIYDSDNNILYYYECDAN